MGNGFPLEEAKGKKAFLMGGGIGVPPILELAREVDCAEKQIVEMCIRDRSKVNKSDVVAKTLTSVNRLIYYVSIVLIGILLAVSIFLISNTVTMGITVRREEIAIMKYIGAKDGFVRAPFIIEGLVIGLIGAVIPLVILYFVYDKAVAYVMTKLSLIHIFCQK